MRPLRERSFRIAGRPEDGDTLIEILLTLIVLSLAIVALITAFSTSISASAENRNLAVTDTVMRSVSESVYAQFQQSPSPFAPCPTASSTYPNLSLTAPIPYDTRYTAVITAVSYWTGTDFSGTSTSSGCQSDPYSPQEITVQVTAIHSNSPSESIQLVIQGTSQINSVPPVKLNAPTVTGAATSTITVGAIVVQFSNSPGAPNGQTYTAVACNDLAMTAGCETNPNYTSGAEFSGLTPGAGYYVEIIANGSPGYVAATSAVYPTSPPPVDALGSSDAPTVTGVSPSTSTAGALMVTYSDSSIAPSGTTYFATACTDQAMKANCVSSPAFTSGDQVTGLTAGTAYYVTVTANAISSFPVSPSAVFPAVTSTVQLSAPTITSANSTASGALSVTYTGSSNAPSGQTYTETECTDSLMTKNCTSQPAGSQVTLTVGKSYYVQIIAVASTGFLSATSATAGPVEITVQLQPPTGVTVAQGSHSGSVKVKFTGSTNATSNTVYTCIVYLDNGGSRGAQVASASCSPGGGGTEITGLATGTTVFVTVTASDANGYLPATSTAVAGPVK